MHFWQSCDNVIPRYAKIEVDEMTLIMDLRFCSQDFCTAELDQCTDLSSGIKDAIFDGGSSCRNNANS